MGRRLIFNIVLWSALLSIYGTLASAQWPMFRYNRRHTGACLNLGPMSGDLKWSSSTTGDVESSAAISADGVIYVGATDNSLYAIGCNGVIRWKYQTGNSISSSPAVGSDGRIYVGSMDSYVYAINPDGSLGWRFDTGYWIKSSPIIGTDGTIYIGSSDKFLYAINQDGSRRWAYETGGWVESSPAIGNRGVIYVGSSDEYLYAINPDGSLQWKYKTEGGVDSSPAVGPDGVIYVGSDDGYLYAINSDGGLRWRYQTGGWIESSPAIGNEGVVYVGSNDGYLYAIRSDGSLAWRYLTGGSIESSPAIDADGVIYVGSDDRMVYALYPDGALKWTSAFNYPIKSSPALTEKGDVIIGSDDLYAIGRRAAWTFLVYLTGDNDLESCGIDDFLEMAEVGSTDEVNIVVQFDRIPGYSDEYGDWTNCHRFLITPGMTPTEESALIDWGDGSSGREVDMGEPQSLVDFITWGTDTFYADHYAVILWNHGNGWYYHRDQLLARGVCIDYTSSSIMGIANGEWRTALQAIYLHLGRKIDILGFDACLMQMLENAYETEQFADYFVGSEETETARGWSYDGILDELTADPELSPESLGEIIVDTSIDNSLLKTQSLVDLSKLQEVALTLNTLSLRLLEAQQSGYWAELKQIRQRVQRFDLPVHTHKFIDLEDYADLLAGEPGIPQNVKSQAQALTSDLTEAIVYSRHREDPDYLGAKGLSIYYPENPLEYNDQYDGLLLTGVASWGEFIAFDPPRAIIPDLHLNRTEFHAGDLLTLDLNTKNYGQARQVNLFVILEIPIRSVSLYYYWPDWTRETQYQQRTIVRAQDSTENILTLVWPEGVGACDLLRFWSFFINPQNGEIVGEFDSIEWSYH